MKFKELLLHGTWAFVDFLKASVRKCRFVCLLMVGFCLQGCVGFSSYDDLTVSIETLALFNQRRSADYKGEDWRGDWLFRRERLELIDTGLRKTKPDLIFFQELMARRGSPSDSDRNILMRGALQGYDWDYFPVRYWSDTQENEFHAVAFGLPIRSEEYTIELKRFWKLGADGGVTLSVIRLLGQRVLLFNTMAPSLMDDGRWYQDLDNALTEALKLKPTCLERVIIAGYLPLKFNSFWYNQFKSRFSLKDTAEGVCEVASDCYTASLDNEIFASASGNESPGQKDRILVHKNVRVFNSGAIFRSPKEVSDLKGKYGLKKIWPSLRYGWGALIQLPRCL